MILELIICKILLGNFIIYKIRTKWRKTISLLCVNNKHVLWLWTKPLRSMQNQQPRNCLIPCHWTSTGLYKINMHCEAESKGMLTFNYQTIEQAKIFSYPLFSLDTWTTHFTLKPLDYKINHWLWSVHDALVSQWLIFEVIVQCMYHQS